ncbi:Rrn10p NDAI_0B02990 [Naumovozyma dairenensis CBS 421]|uniref:Uncharacterized protein n=1 Tax=Naumovozyma dairenensis (strain ATCC 10597 / BCRC 20456 / CBS 421 / NBRC 0211 / NRRL Y-12639) TaxID=1071378 RepID=G0W6C3_NAUDC|nr:hypothetical protein NDAI_0B02990 [Naumovozyma dairenensis CBS 421]CCD23334.1 hypothetical protein NDAI_0B02990 [Naumovozyma dairenensis CBS 421]
MDRNVFEACSDLVTEFHTHKVSADEILAEKIGNIVPIPFKTRDELQDVSLRDEEDGLFKGDLIPNIDLKVVHYFATQLCLRRYPHLINSFDESSLITLGLLIEKWVQDYLVANNKNSMSTDDEEEEEVETEGYTDGGTEGEDQEFTIGKGPSQMISKITNYMSHPGNI